MLKKLTRIEDLIDGETTADDADKSKPHPDIFEAALEKLDGISGQKVIVVGDTRYDIEAAQKIGAATIALLCGGFSRTAKECAGKAHQFFFLDFFRGRFLRFVFAKSLS